MNYGRYHLANLAVVAILTRDQAQFYFGGEPIPETLLPPAVNISYLFACAILNPMLSVDAGFWGSPKPNHAALKYERRLRRSRRGPISRVPVWHSNKPPARLRPGKFKEIRMRRAR